jgi:gamma-glutamyltranspeptidase/glutathione hydrolase
MRYVKSPSLLFTFTVTIGIPILLSIGFGQEVADVKSRLLNQGPKEEAIGDKVMVSTQLPQATECALKVFRDGGNAFDAFITTVLLQQVIEPHMLGHFGVMTGLIYEAKTGKYWHFDGTGERPLGTRGEKGDPKKVSIGGTVKALESIWKRHGTKPWAYYFEPAIKAAEEGVLVTSYMYGILYAAWENTERTWPGGVKDFIKNKAAREFYMPDGYLVPVGKRWKMPAVAEHLRRVAKEGADYLFTGEWGQKFVEASNKHGGRVSAEDMAEYEIRWAEPYHFNYKGHDIYGEVMPSYGGIVVGYNLNILENFDLKGMGHYSESADALEILARTFGRVTAETGWLGDPVNYLMPMELLFSKEYGRMGAEYIRQTRLRSGIDLSPKSEKEEEDGDDSDGYGDGSRSLASSLGEQSVDSNHNSLVDAEGNWISSLHTGHGGTPGVFINGIEATGSRASGDAYGPGRRIRLPITATIVAKDGKPWMALGTPGNPPLPITEVLINILEYGMHPRDAAIAPRFWVNSGSGKIIRIESRISAEVRKEMRARGFKIVDLKEFNWHTGSMQIVWRDAETGKLHGVSDPRRLGHAAGY